MSQKNQKKEKLLADTSVYKNLDEANRIAKEAEQKLDEVQAIITQRKASMRRRLQEFSEDVNWTRFRPEFLPNFLDEPYVIEPARLGKAGKVLEWRVYVPKMVEFHVGRKIRTTHSYNVFQVTQYMHYFAEIPKELADRFPKLGIDLKVVDGLLMTPSAKTEETWSRYRKFLRKREGPGKLRISTGSEWALIAQILEDGGLPFAPQPVHTEDLRPRSCQGFAGVDAWKMRDYQKEAEDRFMEYGAIGIYNPFGTGKSEQGLDLLDQLKGHKLILCSTISLKEQWLERIERCKCGHIEALHESESEFRRCTQKKCACKRFNQALPLSRQQEVHIVTYHARDQIKKLLREYKEFTLVVFDECHHLPAKTFMWLSTIPTKYRLGLTGSPYREDGNINYILALTGYPLGLTWSRFVTEGIISLAQIIVHIVKKPRDKLAILDDLLKRDLGKTMIFCDSLDLGDRIHEKYDIEWIHGGTKNRIEKIRRNERLVISRVGDEGISVPELDTLIEIDFMGGSRMQALQRAGRLSHRVIQPDAEPAVHHILMTEEEMEKFNKRLMGYYDKGFKIDYLHHN